jgi:hypothetical protein
MKHVGEMVLAYRIRWDDKIKMDVEEFASDSLDWIQLAQGNPSHIQVFHLMTRERNCFGEEHFTSVLGSIFYFTFIRL